MVHFTAHDELQLFALLAALAAILALAARGRMPVSVFLVAGGLGLGFVPGLPRVQLPPDLVLVAILPPLLYSAAFFTGLRDLRANLRPISLLAIDGPFQRLAQELRVPTVHSQPGDRKSTRLNSSHSSPSRMPSSA